MVGRCPVALLFAQPGINFLWIGLGLNENITSYAVGSVVINTPATVAGPNKVFKQTVAICDPDPNGTITENEATLFASAWPARKG
jgi:hypothetical protein